MYVTSKHKIRTRLCQLQATNKAEVSDDLQANHNECPNMRLLFDDDDFLTYRTST